MFITKKIDLTNKRNPIAAFFGIRIYRSANFILFDDRIRASEELALTSLLQKIDHTKRGGMITRAIVLAC